jgi:hypothetical protein
MQVITKLERLDSPTFADSFKSQNIWKQMISCYVGVIIIVLSLKIPLAREHGVTTLHMSVVTSAGGLALTHGIC